jgi:transcriptional regulator with XRE-family HTH domain
MANKARNTKVWQQLRVLRQRAKISQEKLAEEMGLTQGMISQLENGKSDYTRSHIEQLAQFFKVDPAELVATDNGESIYSLLKSLPEDDRPRAVEILKALKRTAESR